MIFSSVFWNKFQSFFSGELSEILCCDFLIGKHLPVTQPFFDKYDGYRVTTYYKKDFFTGIFQGV